MPYLFSDLPIVAVGTSFLLTSMARYGLLLGVLEAKFRFSIPI